MSHEQHELPAEAELSAPCIRQVDHEVNSRHVAIPQADRVEPGFQGCHIHRRMHRGQLAAAPREPEHERTLAKNWCWVAHDGSTLVAEKPTFLNVGECHLYTLLQCLMSGVSAYIILASSGLARRKMHAGQNSQEHRGGNTRVRNISCLVRDLRGEVGV